MGFFDDFLKKVPAEDQAVLAKYPELAAATAKMEQDLTDVATYAGQWVNWQKDNWDPESGMTVREKQLADELEAARASLASGVNAGASPAALSKLQQDFEAKLKETQTQNQRSIEGMHMFYRSAAKFMPRHQREFGEDFDPDALMAFMQKSNIVDPEVAYDKMVAGKRSELSVQRQKELDEKHAAELAEAEKRGYEKRQQEAAMGPGGMLPTDHNGGIIGVTARLDKPAAMTDDVKSAVDKAKLGDGSLAALGYSKFLRGELPVQ